VAEPATTDSVAVLGPLQVAIGGAGARLRPAQRRVLAILLLDPGVLLDRETLVDRMWGAEAPMTAATALAVHLSGVRRAAPGLLVSDGARHAVDLDGFRFDRAAFEQLAARARTEEQAGHWDRALRAASGGLAMWRGDPYEELRGDGFAAATVTRVEAAREELADLRIRALLALGRAPDAVLELRSMLARQPFREPLWEQLMLALHRSGRQSEALRVFQEARRVLAEELGIEPGVALRRLEERIVFGDEEIGESGGARDEGSLPQVLTSFVGREDDLGAVTALLEAGRLVTIVGGPGIGKTRLAIEAGHAAVGGSPGRAWFVPLADARSPLDVIDSIAGAAGVRSQTLSLPELAERIADRDALLVLDNCEHQLDSCGDLARQVLARAGRLRILATSRKALGVPGEEAWSLSPLPAPSSAERRIGPGAALASPAVRLFVDRARGADRTFRLTAESAPLVAALCRRADGIPLALELAAAWVPALGVADIAPMLGGDDLDVPGNADPGGDRPDRHRSLDAAIAWSTALLAPGDRDLFHALAVFRGPFALNDVVAICSVDGDRRRVAAAVRRLVAASLLVADRRVDGSVRYRMLVPVHEFAMDRLRRAPDWLNARDRFVAHYLAKTAQPAAGAVRGSVDLAAIDDDLDNLREAFELGLAVGRADDVARALVPLDTYFHNRYLAREQRGWLVRALPQVRDPAIRAGALLSAAFAAQMTNRLDEALERLEAALAAFRDLGDTDGTASCLVAFAGLHSNRGEWSAGAAAARAGRELLATGDDPSRLGVALHYLGTNLAYSGEVSAGMAELAGAAEQFRRADDPGRASQSLSTLAYIGVHTGDETVARRSALQSVELARRSGLAVRIVRALSAVAAVEARWGDVAEARSRLVEVDDLLEAQANEAIFELLFPAGFLLARLGTWRLLVDVVRGAEAAIAATGQGYPVPWRATAGAWLEASGSASAGPDRRAQTGAVRSVEALRRDLRELLDAG
jgi:predicted ATPase/DNA-binding SARP family transcriptional activator